MRAPWRRATAASSATGHSSPVTFDAPVTTTRRGPEGQRRSASSRAGTVAAGQAMGGEGGGVGGVAGAGRGVAGEGAAGPADGAGGLLGGEGGDLVRERAPGRQLVNSVADLLQAGGAGGVVEVGVTDPVA